MPYHEAAKCWEHKRIVDEFETWPLTFFKVINKAAVTSNASGHYDLPLEFPVNFLEEYTYMMGPLVANMTLKRAFKDTLWPVAVTKRDVGRAAKRVFMYSADGWKKFIMENNVKEGHMVVFVLYERASFMVYIFRKCGWCASCIEVHQ